MPARPDKDVILALREFGHQATLIRQTLPTLRIDDLVNALTFCDEKPVEAAEILRVLDQRLPRARHCTEVTPMPSAIRDIKRAVSQINNLAHRVQHELPTLTLHEIFTAIEMADDPNLATRTLASLHLNNLAHAATQRDQPLGK